MASEESVITLQRVGGRVYRIETVSGVLAELVSKKMLWDRDQLIADARKFGCRLAYSEPSGRGLRMAFSCRRRPGQVVAPPALRLVESKPARAPR